MNNPTVNDVRDILCTIQDRLPEIKLALWAGMNNPSIRGIDFVDALGHMRLTFDASEILVLVLESLGPEKCAIGIELVAQGAFSRNEILDTQRIITFFGRSDWREIIEAWRKSPSREIRHVVARVDREVSSYETVALSATHDSAPPTTTTESAATAPPPPEDPLRAAVEAALPNKLRKQATANCMTALGILGGDPTLRWTAESLGKAVERERKSCGARFPASVAAECLRHMKKAGLVAQHGDMFQHKPR